MFDINKDVAVAYACVRCRRSRFKFDYKTFGGLPNVTPSLEKEKHLQTTNFWGFMLVLGGVYIMLYTSYIKAPHLAS